MIWVQALEPTWKQERTESAKLCSDLPMCMPSFALTSSLSSIIKVKVDISVKGTFCDWSLQAQSWFGGAVNERFRVWDLKGMMKWIIIWIRDLLDTNAMKNSMINCSKDCSGLSIIDIQSLRSVYTYGAHSESSFLNVSEVGLLIVP